LVDDFATLGAITARLHAHTKTWQPPAGFIRHRWDFSTSIGSQGHWGQWRDGLGVSPDVAEQLARLESVLERRLKAYGTSAERFGLVHADMRIANLLVSPAGPGAASDVHVIDFDDCGFSWFMYDLGASLSFIEDDPRVPELIDAWVRGYRTVSVLSTEDEAELPTFVMLRRLLLVAWIGSHAETETAQQMGPDYAFVTCDLAETYLSRPAHS
jgi:Ser/Thr protein kinase RdoA (MazF antagonist)